ncbi:MAG: hypothetical protein NE327_13310 [Lentisphaeraceae bacterium]|nr:hypothetical protein [Lentisphaeraceae bacterium]
MKILFRILITLSLILLYASCSKDEKTVNQNMGALEGVIESGTFNGWNISKENGSVFLNNSTDTNSVRYYYAPLGNSNSNRSAGVKVDMSQASATGKAGLLYGYDAQSGGYWMTVVSAEGVLEVYKRDQDGLRMVSSQTVEKTANGNFDLAVQEEGNMVKIKVNGRETGSFQSHNTGRGAIGIAALSTGNFKFTGFYQSDSGSVDRIQPVQASTPNSQVQSSPQPVQKAQVANSKNISGSAVEFTEKTVLDEARRNFPAYTILVPKGWEFKAFVKAPNPSLFNIPHLSDIIVKSPDKKRFVHFYPFLEFGYNDQTRGVPMKQAFDGRYFMRLPNSLGQFWAYLVSLDPKQPISNIQIVNEEVVKDATDYVRKAAQAQYQGANEFNQQHGYTGTRFVFDIQVRKLTVRYTYESINYEEVIFASWGQSTVWYPNGTVKAAMWNLNNMYSVGGPPGSNYMEDPVLATVVRSRRVNKDWSYAIDQFYQNRKQMIIKEGMAAIAAARNSWKNTRTTQSEDVLDISFNGWKKRNNMNNAGHSSSINSIHERTTYATPGGSQVNLPSYYQQVYTDGNGNYLLHNNANYQINTDPRFNQQNWQQINPVK